MESPLKKYVIIVAGGSGARMKSAVPKQFHELLGKPVLMHTIEAFASEAVQAEIILVLNVDYHTLWEELVKKHDFRVPFTLVKGGNTRFSSVKNGLKHVTKNSLVAVHDAVRPLTGEAIILEAFRVAQEEGNAVVAVPARDSIRRLAGSRTEAVTREHYYMVQTPQVFKASVLLKAYQQEFRNEFTDDASVVERMGETIHLVEGSYANIKITFPEVLIVAEALLRTRNQ